MTNNEALKAYSFSYINVDAPAPQTVWTGVTLGTDTLDAGFKATVDIRDDEDMRAHVYNVRQVTWVTAELFGMTHIVIGGTHTLCSSTLNPNGERGQAEILSTEISCWECLKAARSLEIPTA